MASDLAAELVGARVQLCRSMLSGDREVHSVPARLMRERRAAEVDQLLSEMRALPSVKLPALQVAVRAVARLAAGT